MFVPKRIIFEKNTLKYDTDKNILETFKDNKEIEIIKINTNRVKEHIPGDDQYNLYREGKKTLVVGMKSSMKFQTCKPSADYQLPLVSGCMGQCEYCYLNTKLGDKPFIKVFANQKEILQKAKEYIDANKPEVTTFEGAATSDPVAVEPYTHSLAMAIEYFGQDEHARFRFVTKYADIDSLINLKHNGHTEVRFSLNCSFIVKEYEHYTASVLKRIEAAAKMITAGYPVGLLIAPVFLFDGWQTEYHKLLLEIREKLPKTHDYPLTFEIISHRYTATAKNFIYQSFPESTLPMKDEDRKFKYGQFGYGKYVYPKEQLAEIKAFFQKELNELFENYKILYII